MSIIGTIHCVCRHWWVDHNDDESCALCGCDWFQPTDTPEDE